MSQILISVLGFLLAIGILIIVHELGHFWVARFFGIQVQRFSIGFGRPLLRWHDTSGTEYVISSIPLGGYVALLGERAGEVSGSERFEAFSFKPIWVRISVLLAGPFFNLIFAVLAYWIMFMIGIASLAPILGPVPKGSIADLAGLHEKQEIISVENSPTPNWEAVSVALIAALGNDLTIDIQVRNNPQAAIESRVLDLTSLGGHTNGSDLLKDLGLYPWDPTPAIVGRVLPDYPAEQSGIKANDRVVAVNGKSIASRGEFINLVQAKKEEKLKIEVLRAGKTETFHVQPIVKSLEDGKPAGFIGIEFLAGEKPAKEYLRVERFGVTEAFSQALHRTWEYTVLTVAVLKKMVTGVVSIKQLSGPIAIAQYAGQTVSIGLEYFLSFLAVISISLGVINLLPIPLLDGGQILYCVWELISGRPLSDQAQWIGNWIGKVFIFAMTLIAIYNDLLRF